MMNMIPPLHLARESRALGMDRELRRQASLGLLTRVGTGVYAETTAWQALDPQARYRARVKAAALISRPDAQFSHDSAAAIHGLPSLTPWPMQLHQLGERNSGTSSRGTTIRHRIGLDPCPVIIEGITVTSLPRTLIDIARTSPLDRAVTMFDHALWPDAPRGDAPRGNPPRLSKTQIQSAMNELGSLRGLGKAQRALAFADGLSGSPAESFCRVQFMAIGLPPPVLQKEIFDERGSIGFVDFYWPDLDLVVEYDGRSKYGEGRQFQRGISPERVLWEEKVREDRIRRVVSGFSRLINEVVASRSVLAQHLRPFGLQPRIGLQGRSSF